MMLYDEDSGSQPFMGCGLLLKSVNTCSSIGFCNITAELFSKGLCLWPQKNWSVAAMGAEGPG